MREFVKDKDLQAYLQIKEAIDWLFAAVWDRWHPNNPATAGQAPPVVYSALEDLRPLVRELAGLWEQLGYSLQKEARS